MVIKSKITDQCTSVVKLNQEHNYITDVEHLNFPGKDLVVESMTLEWRHNRLYKKDEPEERCWEEKEIVCVKKFHKINSPLIFKSTSNGLIVTLEKGDEKGKETAQCMRVEGNQFWGIKRNTLFAFVPDHLASIEMKHYDFDLEDHTGFLVQIPNYVVHHSESNACRILFVLSVGLAFIGAITLALQSLHSAVTEPPLF